MVSCSYYLLKLLQKSRAERSQNKMSKTQSTKEDEDSRCRTCLERGTVPIMEDGKALNIREAIKIIADIEIHENDDYPKYLCHECYSLLRGAMLFKKLAQQTDKILRNPKPDEDKLQSPEKEQHDSLDTHQIDSPVRDQLDSPDRDQLDSATEDLYHDELLPQDLTPKKLSKKIKTPKKKKELPKKQDSEKPVKRKLRVPKDQDENDIVNCHICNKDIIRGDYKFHLENRHCTPCVDTKQHNLKSLRVECNLCKKTLHNQWVIKHFTTVHTKNPPRDYVCDICGNTYLYKAGLYNHTKLHGKEFPYQCPQCPYRGKTSTNLKAHSQIHTNNYKYKCTDCPAKYRHWSQLNIHKRKHRNPEIKCVECTKLFHTPMAMEKHYKIQHMGIKSHVCNICNTAYSYRKSLVTHQNRVHNRMRLPSGGRPAYLRTETNKTEGE